MRKTIISLSIAAVYGGLSHPAYSTHIHGWA